MTTYATGNATELQGTPVSNTGPSLSEVLTFNGTAWAPAPASGGGGTVDMGVNGFRLTLTSGTPITTTDVTGASQVFLTPMVSGLIACYYSSAWTLVDSAEISFFPTTVASSLYDVFVYYNGSVIQLELSAAWASSTLRTDALTRQDGVWVKQADHTRRWVGTIATTASNALEDSVANRFLWNNYNRVERHLSVVESTSFWGYTSSTWRQANGSSSNTFNMVLGDVTFLEASACALCASSSVDYGSAGVGIDSTSVNSAITFGGTGIGNSGAGVAQNRADYRGYISKGLHAINWLEAGGTSTQFFGTNGTNRSQSGMVGTIRA